jgi:TPR repeat protein
LITFARQTNLGEVYALIGMIFQYGIGVDVDGHQALRNYQEGFNREFACCEKLMHDLEISGNPMIRAQVAHQRRDIKRAQREYLECRDPLGIARFGEFLLLSTEPSIVDSGKQLLEKAAQCNCAVACYALGKYYMRTRMFEPAVKALARAVDLGHPDAAFLIGCICAQCEYSPIWLRGFSPAQPREWFERAAVEFCDPRAAKLVPRGGSRSN